MSDVPELDDIAARALACIILDATADTIGNQGATAADVLEELAAATALSLDVCAAIMFATTALCVAGEIDATSITGASMALEPDDDNAPEATPVGERTTADMLGGLDDSAPS